MCQAVGAGNTFGSKEQKCPPAGSYVISTQAYITQIRKSCSMPEVSKSQGKADKGMGSVEAGARLEGAVRAGFTAQVQVRGPGAGASGQVCGCWGQGKGAGGGTASAEASESGGSGNTWGTEGSGAERGVGRGCQRGEGRGGLGGASRARCRPGFTAPERSPCRV